MRKKIALIAISILACSFAAAQPGGMNPWERLSQLDTDGDGAISPEEFSQISAKRFDRLDTNGDGFITEDEIPDRPMRMRRGGEHRPSGMMLAMIVDGDRDGTVTPDEWSSFLASIKSDDSDAVDPDKLLGLLPQGRFGGEIPEGMRERILQRLDKDGNGVFEISDLELRFAELDADGNGFLEGEEMPMHRRRGGERMAEGMRAMLVARVADANEDRAVTAEEWATFIGSVSPNDDGLVDVEVLTANLVGPGMRGGPEGGLGQLLDVDGDGALEVADLEALFASLDQNGNGEITSDELPQFRGRSRGMNFRR